MLRLTWTDSRHQDGQRDTVPGLMTDPMPTVKPDWKPVPTTFAWSGIKYDVTITDVGAAK
jgi:hypothetical protein